MYPCGWNTPKITVFWGRLNEPYENLSLDSELVVDLEICPFKVTFFFFFFFFNANFSKQFRDEWVNPSTHNGAKWPNILQKSCGVQTARFFKYVWPFCNIMLEMVKGISLGFVILNPETI